MVKKANRSWHVDSISGHALLSFVDAFFGYHQNLTLEKAKFRLSYHPGAHKPALGESFTQTRHDRRLLKWEIELSEFDIEYRPRTTIKAQALAGFIVKTTYEDASEPAGTWQIAVDGSGGQTGAGAGVVMTSPEGKTFEYVVRFGFKASNNEAEYEAALTGISLNIAAGARKIVMITDSQLVSSQIEGMYEAR